MAKVLSKKYLVSGATNAVPLTGNGEVVEGVIPRAGHKELQRLRDRRLEFAMKDPSIISYMNNRTLHGLLLEAFAMIRELQAKGTK